MGRRCSPGMGTEPPLPPGEEGGKTSIEAGVWCRTKDAGCTRTSGVERGGGVPPDDAAPDMSPSMRVSLALTVERSTPLTSTV